MFKRHLCFIAITVLFLSFVTSCDKLGNISIESVLNADEPKSTQVIVDRTVNVETFDPKNFSKVEEVAMTADFEKIYKNIDEVYAAAENVVYGTVKRIKNFDESGAAYVLYDFVIADVYKGSLSKNDMISVLARGGYVRLAKRIELYGDGRWSNYTKEEINDTVIKSDNMGIPTPIAGEKYLLFLSAPINNEPPFPNDAYSEMGSFMGRYVEKNGEFFRYTPTDEPNFYGEKEKRQSVEDVKDLMKNKRDEIK